MRLSVAEHVIMWACYLCTLSHSSELLNLLTWCRLCLSAFSAAVCDQTQWWHCCCLSVCLFVCDVTGLTKSLQA